MIPDYECDAVYFSEWLERDYPEIYRDVAGILDRHRITWGIIPGTKDVWCRDYMPVQLDSGRFLCYRYAPDYLARPHLRRYVTDPLDVCRRMGLDIKETSLVIDGGNVVKAGDKVIMTEKVLSENPGFTIDALKREIEGLMECEAVFIPWDKEEKYGHSDGIVKPVSDRTVLLTNYRDYDAAYTEKVKDILSRHFEVLELAWRGAKHDPRNWAYINFLTVSNLIVLPALGIDEDGQAVEQIRQYYPACTVEQVNISRLLKDGGGLNCVSWCRQMPV